MTKFKILSACLAMGLLAGCQQSAPVQVKEPKQGLVQTMREVEAEEVDQMLKELHEQDMKIIDIKLTEKKDIIGSYRTVYTIIYENQ